MEQDIMRGPNSYESDFGADWFASVEAEESAAAESQNVGEIVADPRVVSVPDLEAYLNPNSDAQPHPESGAVSPYEAA